MSDLQKAAQAVLDRWESSSWEWVTYGRIAALMADLRRALAAQQAEPVADAVLAEREACAQILDRNAEVCCSNAMLHNVLIGNALAIRARGRNE